MKKNEDRVDTACLKRKGGKGLNYLNLKMLSENKEGFLLLLFSRTIHPSSNHPYKLAGPTKTTIHTYTSGHFRVTNYSKCMSLNCGRNLEYPDKPLAPRATLIHANIRDN